MSLPRFLFAAFFTTYFPIIVVAENGYNLWMRYDLIKEEKVLNNYLSTIKYLSIEGNSPTTLAAANELRQGLTGLLGKEIPEEQKLSDGMVIAGTVSSPLIQSLLPPLSFGSEDIEGYTISSLVKDGKKLIVIAGKTEIGLLYGSFHFLRLLQTHQSISFLNIQENPKLKLRMLNHWDNLDRTVERGYAGFSLWKWHLLPEYIDVRYKDYARANASIGINGTVLTNVNANALVLSEQYLVKVSALANVFRPYGIKVYLTARFSAPIELGKLKTADPLNNEVKKWWNDKVAEIYKHIPDFGGFLVKANSEGQPGPQNYGRSHADGANMLADALSPHQGIVMWRAFVYSNEQPEDRFKQAYNEFKPLDGQFRTNVLLQVKNGPIDFQPREPFSPLFGAMPGTPIMAEFQVTQEYLGQGTHLVYQAPLYKETLDSDTYAKGAGSTVAKVIDGLVYPRALTGIAGVANVGDDIHWTGHLFGQSNWYCLGRLAWNHTLSSDQIADEWIRMTFSNDKELVDPLKKIMLESREHLVNYMTPLGLHHIMGWNHHYGPAPWIKDKPRADWTSVYYHKADTIAIGFDRTIKGSNALSQYAPEVKNKYSNPATCPMEYLLWFHRLPWNYRLQTGKSLWDELCYHYEAGAQSIEKLENSWKKFEEKIDQERYEHVSMLLAIQKKEAWWWHDACLSYFQSFSRMPYPPGVTPPQKSLEYYQAQQFHFVPGN